METLHKHYDMGQFQVGTNLAWAVALTTWKQTKKGRTLTLVAVRHSFPPRSLQSRDPRDYPFTVIKLEIDENGSGKGIYVAQTKVHFNKQHMLEASDYLTQPANINNVRQEGPQASAK